MSEVTVSLPPKIGVVDLAIPTALGGAMDAALREIAALDDSHGDHLGSLATLLLRAESVASSKIEHIEASIDDYARALHKIRSNPSATSMVASARALEDLIRSVNGGADLSIENILRAHRILMADDPQESSHAGRLRDMQNWIGGSDYSPREAMYVPPPPETVEGYLADLLEFINTDGINVLVQAAIAHAQFESIHPFTDGSGRIGRALINTILRRRGMTRTVVVPLASALVARRDDYFDTLGAYRTGDARPLIMSFASASRIAATEARVTADRLARMPGGWRDAAGNPRAGSAPAKLLDGLLDAPVFSASEAQNVLGGSSSSAYAAITRLHQAGIIRPLNQRTRDQVWVAADVADELDDLGVRIGVRAR